MYERVPMLPGIIADSRAHRPLPCDENLFTKMGLMRNIVVMAIDDLISDGERRKSWSRTGRFENRIHHQLAVEPRAPRLVREL